MKLIKQPKLLIHSDWFCPGYKAGGPIRSIENISYLLHQDFEIFILTSNQDLGEEKVYPDIIPNKWLKFDERINVCYLSKDNQSLSSIKKQITYIAPDFIYLNSMFSVPFTIYPILLKWLNLIAQRVILAPRGMLKDSALQYKKRKKYIFLNLLKKIGGFNNIHFHATDKQEAKDIIDKLNVNQKYITQLSNPPNSKIQELKKISKAIGEVRLVYIARIHPVKNLLFLLRVLQQSKHDIQLNLYGPIENMEYWEKCKELICNLPSNIKVSSLGALPHHQIKGVLANHHFLVLPTQGENFGHSIFESLSFGRPVIISNQTPWKNLEKHEVGWDLSLSQPHRFLEVIENTVSMNQQTYDLMSKKVWAFANKYIEKSNLKEQYTKLFS